MELRFISSEELEHMQDPIAQLVWKRWLKEGKAELVEEIRKCDVIVQVQEVHHGGIF